MDNAIALSKTLDIVINAIFDANLPLRTTKERLQEHADRIRKNNHPESMRDGIYAEMYEEFGISATLWVNFTGDQDPSGVQKFYVECELSWPTTTYNLAKAKRMVALQTAVVNLAEKIENQTKEFTSRT